MDLQKKILNVVVRKVINVLIMDNFKTKSFAKIHVNVALVPVPKVNKAGEILKSVNQVLMAAMMAAMPAGQDIRRAD